MIINSVNGGSIPQLPEQVETLTVSPGNLSAILVWTEPAQDQNDSFVGTRIVRKIGSCPESSSDGDVVYEGSDLTYTDEGLTDGVTYYYRVFAYNARRKYQNSMRYVSITATSSLPLSSLPEGALINIKENGNAVPFYIVTHDYESLLNGEGRTLLVRKNVAESMHWGTLSGSGTSAVACNYSESIIDTWLNDTYRATLDSEIQEDLGTTFYSMADTTQMEKSSNTSVSDTLERDVFALSARELGVTSSSIADGSNTYYYTVEGTKLSIASTLKKAEDDSGEASSQWTRSRCRIANSSSKSAIELDEDGVAAITVVANNCGVRPALTLPGAKRVQCLIGDDGCYNFA